MIALALVTGWAPSEIWRMTQAELVELTDRLAERLRTHRRAEARARARAAAGR